MLYVIAYIILFVSMLYFIKENYRDVNTLKEIKKQQKHLAGYKNIRGPEWLLNKIYEDNALGANAFAPKN